MTIPREVQASTALARESRFEGRLGAASLPRLMASIGASGLAEPLEAQIAVDAASGYPRVHGRVLARLALECRRCGAGYVETLDLALELRLVYSDEEERGLLQDADPYRVEDDRLPLQELVEEEVLLALPMLPRCARCEDAAGAAVQQPEQPEAPVERHQPFAGLKARWKSNRE